MTSLPELSLAAMCAKEEEIMPSQVTNYQCPSCTAPLHYSESSGRLECDYCGSSFSTEDVERMFAEKNRQAEQSLEEAQQEQPLLEGEWAMDDAGGDWGADGERMRAYTCPSCGAELVCDATTAATSCPYCGNPTVIPGQFGGTRKPDLIIPFRMSREAAVEALKKHYRKKPLLPKAFGEESHIQQIKGVYVPFWLFDAEVDADMSFQTTRTFTHNTSNEVVTETDHFLVHRQGSLRFENVPVDGASKMPDSHMDAIEPFDYSGLKPFSLSYLPGFLANQYDVSREESVRRANARCAASTEAALRNTVLGYQSCITTRKNIRIRPGGVKYALMPVWMLSTQWKGKNFLFAMNGQTGKLIGDLPVDKAKLAAFCAGAFAAVSGLTLLLFG